MRGPEGSYGIRMGADHAVRPNTLEFLVNSLRAKIDTPYNKKVIGTVRGGGYVFRRLANAHRDAAR